ncbi:MAG: hypothetical protein RL722_1129 [Pseudomonadota bacterium]
MAASPSLALTARFRRPRLLVIGCGDVGGRVLTQLGTRMTVRVLTSSPERVAHFRGQGVTPLVGSLDRPSGPQPPEGTSAWRRSAPARLAGLAQRVLHLAPPPGQGRQDRRTRWLLDLLGRGAAPQHIVYGSTTGVYGDAGGARFDETRNVAPANERAWRRVDAERRLRRFGLAHGSVISLLRIPGIYALDRPGGDPRERVRRGTPVLRAEDDVYTNHIQADDLARACIAALWRGRPQRVVHVCDRSELRMGDYFDLVADLHGLPRPPRLSRAEATQVLGAMSLSFMSESRRLVADRLGRELRVRLRYPELRDGLTATG